MNTISAAKVRNIVWQWLSGRLDNVELGLPEYDERLKV